MGSPIFPPTPPGGGGGSSNWGSITGTLSDQTDLNMALGGKVPTTRTVNSKALSSDISLTASDVGAQPADATLTALAGLTTAANKLPYATGEDTFDVCDFTPLGRSLIGTTTASAVRDLIASASSTTVTQSIYVDSAATGAGTGIDWTNAFTTIQAAVDSLPAIINHAVTIYVRKGATPYRETVTVQRVIAGGSVTIRGEYYWSNQAASNSTANRLVKDASDDFTNVEVGDRVTLIQYSGTFDDSYPSGGFYGTVTDVSNKASGYVTISMDSSVTPTTGWRYIITKTVIDGSDDGSTPVRDYCFHIKSAVNIYGFTVAYPNVTGIYVDACCVGDVVLNTLNILAVTKNGVALGESTYTNTRMTYFSIVKDTTRSKWAVIGSKGSYTLYHGIIVGMSYSSWLGHLWLHSRCICFLYGILIRSVSTDDGVGISVWNNTYGEVQRFGIYGLGASNKLATGIHAMNGSVVVTNAGNIDSTTVTTAKNPATWAATTDGSYIS